MDSGALTPTEKLEILERYLVDVSNQIKAGYSKERGTGKSWLTIKEYITNYRKRVTNYDTGKYIQHEPQNVQCHELKEDYFVYDVAIVYNTEKQLINRIAEQVEEIEEVYDDVYLIRMDENKHRESAKSNKLKLHQFGRTHDEVNLAGFQPNFILYLQGTDYFIQIFIEPKGRNIEEEQWKEGLPTYINGHEAEIVFEGETDDVKIKGVKFYTMNDGRGAIRQIGEIALGRAFKGLSILNQ